MELSNCQKYTCSKHFYDRALERFEVKKEQVDKWVKRQINHLSPYDDGEDNPPGEEKYVSDRGVVFVCNTIKHLFITCYQAPDYLSEEGRNMTIHEHNLDLYREEATKLAHRYQLKDGRELLQSVSDHIDTFHKISHQVMKGRLTEKNYHLLQAVIDEFHVVKAAMRLIENKRHDFKAYHE